MVSLLPAPWPYCLPIVVSLHRVAWDCKSLSQVVDAAGAKSFHCYLSNFHVAAKWLIFMDL
jgi:hypothetical protein